MEKIFDDNRKLRFVAQVVADFKLSKLGGSCDILILDTRVSMFPQPWHIAWLDHNGNIGSMRGYDSFDEMYNDLANVDKSKLLKFILASQAGGVQIDPVN